MHHLVCRTGLALAVSGGRLGVILVAEEHHYLGAFKGGFIELDGFLGAAFEEEVG